MTSADCEARRIREVVESRFLLPVAGMSWYPRSTSGRDDEAVNEGAGCEDCMVRSADLAGVGIGWRDESLRILSYPTKQPHGEDRAPLVVCSQAAAVHFVCARLGRTHPCCQSDYSRDSVHQMIDYATRRPTVVAGRVVVDCAEAAVDGAVHGELELVVNLDRLGFLRHHFHLTMKRVR